MASTQLLGAPAAAAAAAPMQSVDDAQILSPWWYSLSSLLLNHISIFSFLFFYFSALARTKIVQPKKEKRRGFFRGEEVFVSFFFFWKNIPRAEGTTAFLLFIISVGDGHIFFFVFGIGLCPHLLMRIGSGWGVMVVPTSLCVFRGERDCWQTWNGRTESMLASKISFVFVSGPPSCMCVCVYLSVHIRSNFLSCLLLRSLSSIGPPLFAT